MLALFLLLFFSSCGKTEPYDPQFSLADGYTLSGDVISGRVYGEYAVPISQIVSSGDTMIVFSDSHGEAYIKEGAIPLQVGKNSMVLRFSDGEREREYNLEIELIAVRSFSIEMLSPDRTYHIGEAFDRTTIRVTALTESGEFVEVDRYTPEYSFSEFGENTVGIELGGFYQSFSVMVDSEYLPTLDEDLSADGVTYVLENGNAILYTAPSAAGFFAVPPRVCVADAYIPVTEIAADAFANTALTSVRVPDGVRVIGDGAFASCAALEWVELPERMDAIGRYAFSGCERLFALDLPQGLEQIRTAMFRGCRSLTHLSLPASIDTIEARAFLDCVSLSEMSFPASLLRVEEDAFSGCTSLDAAVFGKLELLGTRAFAGCASLAVFAASDVDELGDAVFDDAPVHIYAAEKSKIIEWAMMRELPVTPVSDSPCVVSLPTEFSIEEGYPIKKVLILSVLQGTMKARSDHEICFPEEACGLLEATLICGEYRQTFSIFVSYTEPVALDADSRGAIYEFNPSEKTAILVSLPEWVRKSEIFVPQTRGLFLVPTSVERPDGVYEVVGVSTDAVRNCQNVSELFIPVRK